MAARYCPQCGGVNSPTATFCQYCGSPLPPAPSAPLSSSGAGTPPAPPGWGTPPAGAPAYGAPPYGAPPYGAPPPARPRRRLWVWILVGLVVIILVVAAVGYFALVASPAIDVSQIEFQSSVTACGLENYSWDGFTANESQTLWLALSVPGNMTGTCTISTVGSATTGFTLTGANVPLTIPANTNDTLQFNVTCPGSSYNGVLTLTAT